MIYYLILINIVTCLLFGLDKHRAVRGQWRIRERTLLLLAAAGGAAGGWAGMYLFRHKTKKARFFVGIPAMLVVQIFLLVFLREKGIC